MSKLDTTLLRKLTHPSSSNKEQSDILYVRIAKNDLQVVFGHPRIKKTSNRGSFYNRAYYINKDLLQLFEEHYKSHQKDKIQQFSKEISRINADPNKDYVDTLALLREDRSTLNSIYREDAYDLIERYVQERIYAYALPGYNSQINKDTMNKIITISTKTERKNLELKDILDTVVADIYHTFKFVVDKKHDDISHKAIRNIPTAVIDEALDEFDYSATFIKKRSRREKMKALAEESDVVNGNYFPATPVGFQIKAKRTRR